MKLKACLSCTNGKRKCDKVQPACGRCNDRDVECRYPPTKRKRPHIPAAQPEHARHLAVNEAPPTLANIDFSLSTSNLDDPKEWIRSLGTLGTISAPILQDDTSATASSTSSSDRKDATHFFVKPDSWVIRHLPFATPSFSNLICMNYVRGIHEFFDEWVAKGHSSFMHKQLYADSGYPAVIQDAFASITLHKAKTAANETAIDDMLASKLSALLRSFPQSNDNTDVPIDLDIREHLSRSQALYVHLVLALFSPSIGARANAEQHIETLLSWTRQLWEAALCDPDICQNENTSGSATSTNAIVLDAMFDGDPAPRLWRSWVLSESIRRIWLLATSTIGVYLIMRQQWAECHGGIYFTAGKKIWDAQSAPAWASACQSSDPLFLCSLECESLFLNAKSTEVDDMLINMFTIMWGVERVENWVARTVEPGESVRVWRKVGSV
ncbi:hypothetical protein ACLX1H_000859 [Fusarium chlamydosporum]